MDDHDRENFARMRLAERHERAERLYAERHAKRQREIATILPWLLLPLVALILLFTIVLPAGAQPVVVDGDTLKLNGTTFRIFGIDAPEMKQRCGTWFAGVESAAYLRRLISDRTVNCDDRGHDRYGRVISRCTAKYGNRGAEVFDIGAEMVRVGMAWAYRGYSREYVPQENYARAELLGVHGYACQRAWEYRLEQKR